MTRNITEWLGFPLHALSKGILLDSIFASILDDDSEAEFTSGKKIEFSMNSFKNALDDIEPHSDDELESTVCLKEKKCRALVWMKLHEHALCPPSYLESQKGIACPPPPSLGGSMSLGSQYIG